MALFKRSREAAQPPPRAADPITIYLADDDRAFDPDPGVHITIEGFSPYLDPALTIPLEENQRGLGPEGIVYSRIAGGTHHRADLSNAVFDLVSQVGLVGIVHELDNSRPERDRSARGGQQDHLHGRLPAPCAWCRGGALVGPGGAANAAVIETVYRGGTRIGLKIIATLRRDMLITTVSH
jgi:hypothetical protein